MSKEVRDLGWHLRKIESLIENGGGQGGGIPTFKATEFDLEVPNFVINFCSEDRDEIFNNVYPVISVIADDAGALAFTLSIGIPGEMVIYSSFYSVEGVNLLLTMIIDSQGITSTAAIIGGETPAPTPTPSEVKVITINSNDLSQETVLKDLYDEAPDIIKVNTESDTLSYKRDKAGSYTCFINSKLNQFTITYSGSSYSINWNTYDLSSLLEQEVE